MSDAPQLRRSLGLGALIFYGVGLILCAGIYAVLGVAAADAGDALWLSFAAGGVAALLTGLAYAELTTTYPRAGAEYVYVAEALPRARGVAAVLGIVIVLAAAAMAATVALAFAGYLRSWVAVPAVPIAIAVCAVFTGLNLAGLQTSTWFNVACTVIELAGLGVFVAIGAGEPDFGAALGSAPTFGVVGAAALVFFAYLGFEDLANLVEETRDPERTLPRALLISIAVTTGLYVLVALAAVALVTPEVLAGSDAPLSDAVAGAAPWAQRGLAAVALFATANTALITMVAASRMIYGMARGGDLPAGLGAVSRRGTPWAAALVMLGLVAALIPLGSLAWIAGLASFGALVAFAAIHAALIALRFRDPERRRPFRMPGAIRGVPVLAALGVISTVALAAAFPARVYLAGAVGVAASTLIYVAARRARTSRRARGRPIRTLPGGR
jgi:basic amino acid/polyamine antiporter, APA family